MRIDRCLDRELPHNLEAERSVLGAILLDNHAFHTAIEIVDSADFFLDWHRRIFARIIALAEENRAIDLITLHDELERAGELEAAGGSAYLSSLVDGVPRVANVEHYARIVREKAVRRTALREAANLEDGCPDEARALPEVLRQAGATIHELERKARTPARTASSAEDGATLLRELERFIRRFVVLPPKTCLPVVLWAMATHVFDEFSVFPYLSIVGPTRRCGKTRLLRVLELVAHNPRRAAGISEAALFRLVEAESPTLLLDEAESLRGKGERPEALRQLLNAGHGEGAVVYRCVGQEHELRSFRVFSPKALAAIGSLPDTLADRSVTVAMQRKKPGQGAERFSARRVGPEGEELRARVAAWVECWRGEIAEAYEGLRVEFLEDDRAAENFEPLFALLFVADLGRFEELRDCAVALAAGKAAADEDEDLRLRLLADIRRVWPAGQPSVFTSNLLALLRREEGSPWAGEVELTPRKLARWLRLFGAEPRTVRAGAVTAKGYLRSGLNDAFEAYLTFHCFRFRHNPLV
jgi:hypothetical protein